jgi:hypothetical protein
MNLIKFNKRKFLIKYNHREDFGHEWYVQILNIKRWSLFQLSVSWNDYPSWPYLQIKSGSGDVLSILFWAYKFGFDIDFISRTWSWDHLEELDEDETELV